MSAPGPAGRGTAAPLECKRKVEAEGSEEKYLPLGLSGEGEGSLQAHSFQVLASSPLPSL